jgi:hypothetical protein
MGHANEQLSGIHLINQPVLTLLVLLSFYQRHAKTLVTARIRNCSPPASGPQS